MTWSEISKRNTSTKTHHISTNTSEPVYAGVLGKIIGVYLGRPFEGWLMTGSCRSFARSTVRATSGSACRWS